MCKKPGLGIRSFAHRSGRSPKMSESLVFLVNRSFAHFWAKNERFARKTDERIPSPAKNSTVSLTTPS